MTQFNKTIIVRSIFTQRMMTFHIVQDDAGYLAVHEYGYFRVDSLTLNAMEAY